MMQVPAPTGDTLEPDTVQTPALDASAEKTTGSPELADAATMYAGSPTPAFAGGVDVKVIVCVLSATVTDCCTCTAG